MALYSAVRRTLKLLSHLTEMDVICNCIDFYSSNSCSQKPWFLSKILKSFFKSRDQEIGLHRTTNG